MYSDRSDRSDGSGPPLSEAIVAYGGGHRSPALTTDKTSRPPRVLIPPLIFGSTGELSGAEQMLMMSLILGSLPHQIGRLLLSGHLSPKQALRCEWWAHSTLHRRASVEGITTRTPILTDWKQTAEVRQFVEGHTHTRPTVRPETARHVLEATGRSHSTVLTVAAAHSQRLRRPDDETGRGLDCPR